MMMLNKREKIYVGKFKALFAYIIYFAVVHVLRREQRF